MTDIEMTSGGSDPEKTVSSVKQASKTLHRDFSPRPANECKERLRLLCITGEPMEDAIANAKEYGLQATFIPAEIVTTFTLDDYTLRGWMQQRRHLFTAKMLPQTLNYNRAPTAEAAALFDYCWTKLCYKAKSLYSFNNYRFDEQTRLWRVDHAPIQRWAVEVPVDIWRIGYEESYDEDGAFLGYSTVYEPPLAKWRDNDWDRLAYELSRCTLTTEPCQRIAELPVATGPIVMLAGKSFCARLRLFSCFLPGEEERAVAERIECERFGRLNQQYRKGVKNIPRAYRYDSKDIVVCGKNPERICREFSVTAAARDAEGTGWGKILVFFDHESTMRELFVPDALHHKPMELFQLLSDNGFDVEPTASAKTHFVQLLSKWRPKEIVNRVNVPGWQHDGAFVGPAGDVVGAVKKAGYHWVSRPPEWSGSKGGLFEYWRTGVVAAFGGKTPQIAIGIALGLAGPVLQCLNLSNRGLYFSGKTSGGKSSAQMAQVSVWSDPSLGRGLRNSARATANGLEFILSCASGTTAAIDDTGNGGAELVQEAVFMAAEGRGKARLSQSAEAKAIRSWRYMTFSISGELTPSQVMSAMRSEGLQVAGANVRCPIIDFAKIEQTERDPFAQTMEYLTKNYGWAGPLMVEAVRETGPSGVREIFDECLNSLRLPGDDTPQIRTAEGLAAMWTACLIAHQFDILPKDQMCEDDIYYAVHAIWANIRSNFEFERLNVEEAASDRLMAWLQTSGDVFELGEPVPPGRTALAWHDPIRRGVDGEILDNGPWTYYVPVETVSKIALGTTPAAAIESMRKSGRLVSRTGEKSWTHPYIPSGVGRVRHYRIVLSAADFGLTLDGKPIDER